MRVSVAVEGERQQWSEERGARHWSLPGLPSAASGHGDIGMSALVLPGPGEQAECMNWWNPG